MSWPIVKLGEVCEIRAGANQRKVASSNGPYPIYGSGGRMGNATEWRCPANTVLVGRKGTLNNPQLIEEPLWNIDTAFGLIGDERLLPKYLYFYCRTVDFELLVPTSGRPSTTVSSLQSLSLPLPPLFEQEQIVEELERKLSRLAKIEGNFRAMAETAAQAFRSALSEAFRSLDAPTVKLGDVCETTSGGTPLKSMSEYYEGGNIPWLRSGEVCQKNITKAKEFITVKGLECSSAKWFPPETVLVAMYGATAGQVGILRFRSTTNQAICGILPSKKFVPEFLYYVILGKKDFLISQAVGGAQPNISQQKIKSLPLPLPPLFEQERIVEELEWKLSRLAKVEQVAREAVAVCAQARRAVLVEAFRHE